MRGHFCLFQKGGHCIRPKRNASSGRFFRAPSINTEGPSGRLEWHFVKDAVNLDQPAQFHFPEELNPHGNTSPPQAHSLKLPVVYSQRPPCRYRFDGDKVRSRSSHFNYTAPTPLLHKCVGKQKPTAELNPEEGGGAMFG